MNEHSGEGEGGRTLNLVRRGLPPRVLPFAEQMIQDLRQRFFDGIDSEILVMQNPMSRLQHMAENASFERYQRRIERLFEAKQCQPTPSLSDANP